MDEFLQSKLFKRTILPVSLAVLVLGIIALVVILTGLPSEQAAVSAQTPQPTAAPTASPEPEPTVYETYIPDPQELQELPNPEEIRISDGDITAAYDSESLIVSWAPVPQTDYYVLCVLDDGQNVLHKEILWGDISRWNIYGYAGSSVMVLAYHDMGEKGADDDALLLASQKQIGAPQPDENAPAAAFQNAYRLLLDKDDHALGVFTYDENGEYTVLLHVFPCATGRSKRMTPLGEFEISSKGEWKRWNSSQYSPFYTKYTSGLYIHGALYRSKRGDTLRKGSYEDIGTNATSGCLRTTYEAAKWVYFHCPAGTVIEIVQSSDLIEFPGLVPIDESNPKWDPTDPRKPPAVTE